jgi:hypothetical protein
LSITLKFWSMTIIWNVWVTELVFFPWIVLSKQM